MKRGQYAQLGITEVTTVRKAYKRPMPVQLHEFGFQSPVRECENAYMAGFLLPGMSWMHSEISYARKLYRLIKNNMDMTVGLLVHITRTSSANVCV